MCLSFNMVTNTVRPCNPTAWASLWNPAAQPYRPADIPRRRRRAVRPGPRRWRRCWWQKACHHLPTWREEVTSNGGKSVFAKWTEFSNMSQLVCRLDAFEIHSEIMDNLLPDTLPCQHAVAHLPQCASGGDVLVAAHVQAHHVAAWKRWLSIVTHVEARMAG